MTGDGRQGFKLFRLNQNRAVIRASFTAPAPDTAILEGSGAPVSKPAGADGAKRADLEIGAPGERRLSELQDAEATP